jgi:NADH:ubiquinone oxidoreductase subunit E
MIEKKIIIICMGSSCFSRGNGENYKVITDFLKEKNLAADVLVKGCRCGGQCMNGPNIWINEQIYSNVDQGSLIDILKHEF